jgi:hypothetical protein
MKSVLGKSSGKKTMRVATAFTGVAAACAAFAPAAQAAPDNAPVPQPYTLWVKTGSNVSLIQVCGWKDIGGGEWYCTADEYNPFFPGGGTNYFGGNWKRGEVSIVMDTQIISLPTHQFSHRCNTNGAYHGVFRPGGVSLSAGYHNPLGVSYAEC